MNGDDQVRFCGSCEKNVFDISSLSADAAVELIREKQGKICIQIYRRRDGTVLTDDCPKGLQRLRQGFVRKVACVVAAFGFLGSAGVADAQPTGPRCNSKNFGAPMRGEASAVSTEAIVDPTAPQMNDVQSTTPIVVQKGCSTDRVGGVVRLFLAIAAVGAAIWSSKHLKRKPAWVTALVIVAVCAIIGFTWM